MHWCTMYIMISDAFDYSSRRYSSKHGIHADYAHIILPCNCKIMNWGTLMDMNDNDHG